MPQKIIHSYSFLADDVPVNVSIYQDPKEFILLYNAELPQVGKVTQVLLQDIKEKLTHIVSIRTEAQAEAKKRFTSTAIGMIQRNLPNLPEDEVKVLAGLLYQQMLGLGQLEILLKDDELEEVAILNAKEPIWVYHRKFGWLKTNLFVSSEDQISNFASIVGRKVGRRITVLTPLLDAHLESGDRVNATLFPITTKGNTLTIRKMRHKPWLVNELIENHTMSSEVMALIWTAIQYELSILVAGGTASGKTTFLNMLTPFFQPNHRIISIEDTRELNLPSFLHWIPMVTRIESAEGKGEVSMLDLLVNSLRMRPDRMIVGEVRRRPEAEVLFEAMHTGHSVYATIHADTAEQAVRRLTTPPIDLPESEIEALPLIVAMFRQRRIGIRRVLQVAELIPSFLVRGEEKLKINTLYRWRARTDSVMKMEASIRLYDQLQSYTGLTEPEIKDELTEKQSVLEWITKQKITEIDQIGALVSRYYGEKDKILDAVAKNKDFGSVIGA